VTKGGAAAAITAAVGLTVITAVFYTARLAGSPPYLMHDELQFSLQARSIAENGTDLAGRRLPVFFSEPEFPAGRDPVAIYFTAAFLKFLPFSQAGVKLPTVLIGILNVVLMFVAGWLLSGRPWCGVIAAALLAMTPIHLIRSRLVLSPFYSIPFILLWLIALAVYLRSGSRRALIATAVILGLSIYSYLACVVMAPIYFAMTAWLATRREGIKAVAPMAIAAAVVLTPLAVWTATHPERYSQLIEAYRLYGSRGDASAAVLAPGTPAGLQTWVALVWQFFSPDFLFISGDSSLINSTRTAGLFPIAFAILIPAGIWSAIRSRETWARVVLAGFVTAPLASLVSGAVEMNRIMFVIPFGALLATAGVTMWLDGGRLGRIAATTAVAAIAVQFAVFHGHYLERYPAQAALWFGGNVRDAVTEVSKGEGPIYLSAHIPFGHRYWSFYAPNEQRLRLVQTFTDLPESTTPGARAACPAASGCDALRADARWRQVAAIREPSGDESFLIFERQ